MREVNQKGPMPASAFCGFPTSHAAEAACIRAELDLDNNIWHPIHLVKLRCFVAVVLLGPYCWGPNSLLLEVQLHVADPAATQESAKEM